MSGRPPYNFARGQIGVLLTFAIVALVGAMALGADLSVMYVNHLKLQNSVDAAALAGGVYINGGVAFMSAVAPGCAGQPDDAAKAACTYASSNGLAVDSASLRIFEPGQNLPASVATPNIQVWAQRTVPSYFGRIIGAGSHTLSSIATAGANSPAYSVTTGLFPMAVQCTNPCSLSNLNPGQAVQFGVKFSPTGSASGNWQWLAVGGEGASALGASIQNGVNGSYSVGQTISSEPGKQGNQGPIMSGFSARMSSCASVADPCSGANPNNIPTGDPCLATVAAVDFAGCKGSCSVAIEAFANVYIEPSSTASNINACFVRAVTANSIAGGSATAASLGATTPPSLVQ